MTTRLGDSKALIKRCKKVADHYGDWELIQGTGGIIKVKNHVGAVTAIHQSYSDVRSLINVEQRLKRLGLHQRESDMADLKFSSARQNNDKARAAADKKAEAIAAKNNAAVARAAGSYLLRPEDVGVVWFAEKHPAPWMRVVNMTPEIARYLLENHNTNNRPLYEPTWEHYRRIILADAWRFTHQGAAMDTEAVLQDSQHRLMAIQKAGEDIPDLKVPMAFWVGMPVENFAAIDEGRLRTAAQLFTRDKVKQATNVQTTVRMWLAYRADNPRHAARLKRYNAEVLDAFEADREAFLDATVYGVNNYRKLGCKPSAMSSARYILGKECGEGNPFVHAFLWGLTTGAKRLTRVLLDDDDPRVILRRKLENAKRGSPPRNYTGLDQLAMIIICWNNVVQNLRPRILQYRDDTPFPRPLLCTPEKSAPPVHLRGELD